MSRLTAFDPNTNRAIRIDGNRYTVRRAQRADLMLTVVGADGVERAVTRTELAALIVQARAAFANELEPEPPSREVTDISGLSIHRLVDWFSKLYLLRRLAGCRGSSPRNSSSMFMRCYEEAADSLRASLALMGISGFKTWSPCALYHDLRRMDDSGWDLAALQIKGVEYCPHSQPDAASEPGQGNLA